MWTTPCKTWPVFDSIHDFPEEAIASGIEDNLNNL
jgi:hypothetical protein